MIIDNVRLAVVDFTHDLLPTLGERSQSKLSSVRTLILRNALLTGVAGGLFEC